MVADIANYNMVVVAEEDSKVGFEKVRVVAEEYKIEFDIDFD